MAALSRFIQKITSRAVIGVPLDHCQCFMVMVATVLLSENTGALAMLSVLLKVGSPFVPNQYSGGYMIWEKSEMLVTLK